MERQRTSFAPALVGALALHLAVLLAGFLAWPWMGSAISPASVTAVTIVAAAPSIPPPAEKAPQPAPPTSPEPAPTPSAPPPAPAPPVPSPPTPKPPPPKPAPPQPAPTPIPTPAPKPPPKPAPQQAQPAKSAKPSQDLDLSALASSLQSKSDTRRGPGAKGPPRLELSQIERLDEGSSPAARAATVDAAGAVGARLNRIWNKRCEVEGFRNLDDIRVQFQLTPEGGLQGAPQVVSPHKSDPVWQAAAEAAVRAVYQAQPFTELPRQTYSQWRTFTANYQAKEACK